jgi:hypothetical protein
MFSEHDSFVRDTYRNLDDNDIFAQIQNYSHQMRKKVRVAITFMLLMSVACTILATIVWKEDRSNEKPSRLLLGVLFTLTAIFDLFQIVVLS